MRVLLVSANTERLKMRVLPLGPALVGAALRRGGHQAVLLDLLSHGEPGQALQEAIGRLDPQVIGISVRNIDDQNFLEPRFLLEPVRELVQICREVSRARIVLGGAGYSMFPDAALAYVGAELGLRGEGEVVFPEVVERLGRGEGLAGLSGVHVLGRGALGARVDASDLDGIPMPESDFLEGVDLTDPELWVPVQTRRGCALDCSYCSTSDIEGRGMRARSPRQVAEYLARVCEAGARQFYFVDNTFNLPATYAMELCRAILDLGLNLAWRCIVYPHEVPKRLVAAMAEAGCVEVSLGFESGCARVLEGMNKRFRPAEVRRISAMFAEHGIRRMGFLMLGGPHETRESAEESLAFADSLGLEMLSLTVGIRIYPRTPLARLAMEEGLVSPDDDLLHPRFYIRPELEDWLTTVVEARSA